MSAEDVCVCGCERIYHVEDVDTNPNSFLFYCCTCFSEEKYQPIFPHNPAYHKFKLDNLALVERIAEKRGLV